MKLSTTTAIYRDRTVGPRIPILDSVKKCAAAGFESIDLNFCYASRFEMELNTGDWRLWVEQGQELMNSLKITAGQAHTPFYNGLDTGVGNREYIETMIDRAIEAAGLLGVQWIVMHPGTDMRSSSPLTSLKGNVEYFLPHLELAARYGMGIAIENIFDARPKFGETARRRFGVSADELLELTDNLSKHFSNVGICWDTGHANESHCNQGESINMIGSRLKALHINDNYGFLDDHLLPFQGTICWHEVMDALASVDYRGDFTLETHKFTQDVPEELIDDALAYTVKVGRYLLDSKPGSVPLRQ